MLGGFTTRGAAFSKVRQLPISVEQAKKSDPASGRRSEARRRRARSPPRDNRAKSHWTPASAGVTA